VLEEENEMLKYIGGIATVSKVAQKRRVDVKVREWKVNTFVIVV